MKTLSIIVTAHNEVQHLGRLKDSIDRLLLPDGVCLETILIDDASDDGTPGLARKCAFDKVVERPKSNIPACRNAGVRESTGQWIAFTDADCELAPDWLVNASVFLQLPDPVLIGWPVSPPMPATWVQQAWQTHWLNKNRRFESSQGHHVIRHEAFRLIATANMAMNREVMETLCRFDEKLPTGEDSDFVFRAHQAGFDLLACPDLKVVHHGEPATLRQFYRQQVWHAQRGNIYSRIRRTRGGQVTTNAHKFSVLFVICSCAFVVGLAMVALTHDPWALLVLLPLPVLVGLPACAIAMRGKRPDLILPLCALYFAYGAARGLNLLGLGRATSSWRSAMRKSPPSTIHHS